MDEFVSAKLLARGVDLAVEGSENYGWVRDDALQVVDQAEQAGLLVLGGDVWLSVGGRYRHALDNWYWDDRFDEAAVGSSLSPPQYRFGPTDEGVVPSPRSKPIISSSERAPPEWRSLMR